MIDVSAFYKNDAADGYAVRLLIADDDVPEWHRFIAKIEKLINDKPDPQSYTMKALADFARKKAEIDRWPFAAHVVHATERKWIPNDEYNGLLMMAGAVATSR